MAHTIKHRITSKSFFERSSAPALVLLTVYTYILRTHGSTRTIAEGAHIISLGAYIREPLHGLLILILSLLIPFA
jgi:hypothetical protein